MTEDLAYDLRQKYAEIVGVHLERVSTARISKNYPQYFQSLEDLYTVVKHKFKKKKRDADEIIDPDKKTKKKEVKKTDLEIFKELRQKAIDLANKYPNVYLGQTEDPKEISELEGSFRDIEMFLFSVMDNAKMFGSVGYNEGM